LDLREYLMLNERRISELKMIGDNLVVKKRKRSHPLISYNCKFEGSYSKGFIPTGKYEASQGITINPYRVY